MHHYYNMGVGHFYIMDDNSQPPLSYFSQNLGIPPSALTFDYQPLGDSRAAWKQYALADRCMHTHAAAANHTWMGFLDVHEFLETRGAHTLRSILADLSHRPAVGALAINLRIHSSAGLLARPESCRKAFTKCIGDGDAADQTPWLDNKAVRSMVKVASYHMPMNAHRFFLKDGQETVGERGDVVPYGAVRVPVTRDRIAVHQYVVRSKAEFEEGVTRGTARGWQYWNHIEEYRVMHDCYEMQKYEP